MASHGLPPNATKEFEGPQRLDACSSVSPAGAPEDRLISSVTCDGAIGIDDGTAQLPQHEEREMRHVTGVRQVLPQPIDTSFPPLPNNLWLYQSALVKDSRAREHPIRHIIIDTASVHSAITLAKANRLGLKQLPTLKKLALADGSIFEAVRFVTLRLRLPDIGLGEVQVNALILPRLPQGRVLLIGLTEIINHNIAARIVERQNGWETSTGPVSALDPEPSHDLACALFSDRTPGESIIVDGGSGSLLADIKDAEQREEDEEQRKAVEAEAAHALAIRENSMANMATVPSSSSSARSSTESWQETCDEGSQDTELTSSSTTPK